jgi:hypothetical protein
MIQYQCNLFFYYEDEIMGEDNKQFLEYLAHTKRGSIDKKQIQTPTVTRIYYSDAPTVHQQNRKPIRAQRRPQDFQ